MNGRLKLLVLAAVALLAAESNVAHAGNPFVDSVAPVLSRRCLSCHGETKAEGGLSLTDPNRLLEDGHVEASDASASHLIELITPRDGRAEMPKDADPLTADEIAAIVRWIEAGAVVPDGFRIMPPRVADRQWWSLRPITERSDQLDSRSIDDFLGRRHREIGLDPLPAADPTTLLRRITYDLTGLPPTVEQLEAFLDSYRSDPEGAWHRVVQRLLDAPEFGEKWGRHWLDLARYAETHGYDKDQPRNNAWPYRDYVINSFNVDKPVGEFVREQIAGDGSARDPAQGIVATGFLAAGPWDLIAHKEVGEGKLDGRIAKHLDRDEMATAIFNVFQSTTIQCAQCHNHKFDPIESIDYYRVHAVLAGIDRADRVYAGLSAEQQAEKRALQSERAGLVLKRDQAKKTFDQAVAERAAEIDPRIEELSAKAGRFTPPSQHGFHSTIAGQASPAKWVQVDLGSPKRIRRVELIACYDDFNNIGAGFGFPVRFKVEASASDEFGSGDTRVLFDATTSDFANPGAIPVAIECDAEPVRWIRVTATRLAERRNDYILALGELRAIEPGSEKNVASGAHVSASDQIPPNARWAPEFLVDDRYHRLSLDETEIAELGRLRRERQAIVDALSDPEDERRMQSWNQRLAEIDQRLKTFPVGELVYAVATDFQSSGQFRPTKGELRPIHFLHRGDLKSPGERVLPGAPPLWPDAPTTFADESKYEESEARAALAEYVTRDDNPLLWRSMANRIWQWTFGKPLVATPNDFGRMGAKPTHPELLDALAACLRDDPNQSVKSIVRMLVQTDAYRRASSSDVVSIRSNSELDAENDFLWKFNRRRLTAEEFRDTVLSTSGVLRLDERGGPSFKDFVVEHPQHSPHYEYHLHDPNDPKSHRRTIYRFVVRSQPQPMLTTLDCADPSISVARRDESTTALQALTQWNNHLVAAMAKRFAVRIDQDTENDEQLLKLACKLAWGRDPDENERQALEQLLRRHGKETLCRVVLNASAMMYVE